MKSGNLICSKFLHNWDRASRIKSPLPQRIANHSFGNFDIFNILFNILIQYIEMHNQDRVLATIARFCRELQITALETLNFEARFSKVVEMILWRSSETAILSIEKQTCPHYKAKKQSAHEFIYCRCVVNLERSSQNVFKVITMYAGSAPWAMIVMMKTEVVV